MTIETALARLTAGLDRDEAIARAANPDGSGWDVRDFEEEGIAAFPSAPAPEELGGRVTDQTRHMERQDPKATLDRVEAIRRVLAIKEDRKYGYNGMDELAAIDDALTLVVEALAGIYTEPTLEKS